MNGGRLTAAVLRDRVCAEADIFGDPERPVDRPATLARLEPGSLAFLSKDLASDGLADLRARLEGVTLFCSSTAADALRENEDTTLIVVANPRLSFLRAIADFFAPRRPAAGVHPTALLDPQASISSSASIGAYCVVGPGCHVAANAVLHPHVVLMADVAVGQRVTIASGTVIGADGFGYERNDIGELEKFPHIGGVVIGDDVEIGSNTSIDRGTLAPTLIGSRVRIDNQVHIAHNVVVGDDAAIIAQAMIGGSVKIGERAWIAPSAVIKNQVTIGSDAVVGFGAVVVKNVIDGETVMGSPAQPDADFRRARAALKRLTDDAR